MTVGGSEWEDSQYPAYTCPSLTGWSFWVFEFGPSLKGNGADFGWKKKKKKKTRGLENEFFLKKRKSFTFNSLALTRGTSFCHPATLAGHPETHRSNDFEARNTKREVGVLVLHLYFFPVKQNSREEGELDEELGSTCWAHLGLVFFFLRNRTLVTFSLQFFFLS